MCFISLTSNRREVDANQQCEEGGDIIDYIWHIDVAGRVNSPDRWQLLGFYQHSQRTIV